MVAVLMLAGLLVDAARISVGRSMVDRSVELAADSLLAEYSSKLKDDYGLFAMPVSEKYELQDRFEEYLSCNLGHTHRRGLLSREYRLFSGSG